MENKTVTIEEVIKKINKVLAENEQPPVEPTDDTIQCIRFIARAEAVR